MQYLLINFNSFDLDTMMRAQFENFMKIVCYKAVEFLIELLIDPRDMYELTVQYKLNVEAIFKEIHRKNIAKYEKKEVGSF